MPRVADTWTNRDIQNDPAGYREAQRREREQAEVERKKQEELDSLERFKRQFVADGGDPQSAEAEWRRARNERAAESARAREERTRREEYERRMRSV